MREAGGSKNTGPNLPRRRVLLEWLLAYEHIDDEAHDAGGRFSVNLGEEAVRIRYLPLHEATTDFSLRAPVEWVDPGTARLICRGSGSGSPLPIFGGDRRILTEAGQLAFAQYVRLATV